MNSQTRTVSLRRKTRFRTLVAGLLGRVIRRGFFRLVLLGFLLLVLVFVLMNVLASRNNANRLLDEVAREILDSTVAEITWDRDRTEITGPDVVLTGEIRVYDLRVRRRGGKILHPSGRMLEYDLLSIPELRISYDLKRAPDLPVSRIEFRDGLELYFNTHENLWLDEDLFRKGGTGAAPSLPEIVVQGAAVVNVRADGILVPPETLPAIADESSDWYRFNLRDLGLQFSGSPDEYALRGTADFRRVGLSFDLGGTVRKDATKMNIQFSSAAPIRVNPQFVSILSPQVRATADQFQVEATAAVSGAVNVEQDKPVDFRARVDATEGSLCFSGFPVKVDDVRADIRIENKNLRVTASGLRNGARVSVTAAVDDVGGDNELLKVNVQVRDLLVDEQFRKALLPARLQPENAKDYFTLEPWPEGEFDPRNPEMVVVKGYPDWPGIRDVAEPDVDPILAFVCRAFTPMGLANFSLELLSQAKGSDRTGKRTIEQDLRWKVFVRNASACYTAEPEKPGTGFPVPLRECFGVVEGHTRTGQPGIYTVRGYTAEELAGLERTEDTSRITASSRGLQGRLASPGGTVWIKATYEERTPAQDKARLTLELSSEGVNFSEQIAGRMPQNVQDAISQFTPRGRVDIQDATVTVYPETGDSVMFDFRLRANNVAAVYKFKDARRAMQFSEVEGSLTIRSQETQVALESVRGKLQGSELVIGLNMDRSAINSLTVRSDTFELSNDLRDMLPGGVAVVLDQFLLSGQVQIDVFTKLGLDDGAGLAGRKSDLIEAEVRFKVGGKGSVEFKKVPYTLTDVTGRVFVSMTGGYVNVFIQEFRGLGSRDPGRPAPGWIQVSGRATVPVTETAADGTSPPGPEPVYDLHITADELPVDERLLTGMTPLLRKTPDEAAPAVVQFIRDLQVTGTVGANGRVVSDTSGKWDWRIEVFLRNTGINFARRFAYPLEDLNGTVIVDGADVSLRNVTGRAEKGRFTLHQAGYTEADGWSISVSAREMTFHESTRLRDALPEGLRTAIMRMNPRGEFDVDLAMSGRDDYMRFQVSLDVFKTDLDLGLHFDAMTARFDYQGIREGPEGAERTRSNGHVHISEVFFKKARFNDVTSNLQFFDDRLEFPNLRGLFYGGWLEGRFGMLLPAKPGGATEYSGELAIRRADLSELGATAFGTKDLVGVLDSEIKFHSHIDSDGQIGKGRVDIGAINRNSEHPDPGVREQERACKLAAVPLFDGIFKALGGEQNFDEAHVFFWLSPDRITLREMDVVSDAARVELATVFGGDSDNFIMYDTAEMRMKLLVTVLPRLPVPLPGIQEFLDFFKELLMPLYVTGTMGSPRVAAPTQTEEDLQNQANQFPRRPRGP